MDRKRIKMNGRLTATKVEPNYSAWSGNSSFYQGDDMDETSNNHRFGSDGNINKKDYLYNRYFNGRINCFWLLTVLICVFSNFVCRVHCVSLTTAETTYSKATSRDITMVTSHSHPNQTSDSYAQSTKPATLVTTSDKGPVSKRRPQSTQYEPDKVRPKDRLNKFHQRQQQRKQKELKTRLTTETYTTQTTESTEVQTTQTTQKAQSTEGTKMIKKPQTNSKTRKPQTTPKPEKPQTTEKSQTVETQTVEKTTQTIVEKKGTQTSEKPQTTEGTRTTLKEKITEKLNTVPRTSQKPQTTLKTTEKTRTTDSKKELPEITKKQTVKVTPTTETTESVTTPTKTDKQIPTTSATNADDDQCPENSMAYYNITFVPLWSSRRFPKMYPMYRPHAQWSKTIGRTHDHNYTMWKIGSYASVKVKSFAETGVSTDFDSEVQGQKGVLDAFNLPAIGKGFGQSQGSMFVDSVHPLVSFIVKIIPSPDWFVGVSSLNLCSKKKWKKKVIMKLFPVDAGTDIGLTFTSPNWPAYPPEKINRITSSFPDHEASSFHYKSLKKLPRIAYATFYKVEEYRSIFKRMKPYKSRLPSLMDRLPPLVNKPSVANHPYKPSTNAQTGGQPAKSYTETVSSPLDDDNEENFGNITNLLAVAENEPAIPLDCQVSNWGEWGPCSKTCGFGRRERFRFVTQERKNNGYLCPQLKEEALCGSMRNCQWKYFKPFLSIAQKRTARTPGTANVKKVSEQKKH
ncbi:spondin-1-like [Octopus sinensis]|uniref:Spondin-1-like n=1 Tax=Octopus sinensis TaxID=2607531 RepID=A0A6P7U3K3_9MOLL|nr:spondin-1-like [Octopus sinensis]XP_036367600.1 spondin-1-like [Octopus sinensis]